MSMCEFVALDPVKPWRLRCLVCGKITRAVDINPDQLHRHCKGIFMSCPGDTLQRLAKEKGSQIDEVLVSLLNRWGTANSRQRRKWLVQRIGDESLVTQALLESSEECIEINVRKPRGLGDTVASITKAVGIKPCNSCEERRERWNRAVRYRE